LFPATAGQAPDRLDPRRPLPGRACPSAPALPEALDERGRADGDVRRCGAGGGVFLPQGI